MSTQNLDLSINASGEIIWNTSKGDRIVMTKDFQKTIWEIVERDMVRELIFTDERVIKDRFLENNLEEIADNFINERDAFVYQDNFISLLRLAIADTMEDMQNREEEEMEAKYIESLSSGEGGDMVDAMFAGMDEEDYSAY